MCGFIVCVSSQGSCSTHDSGVASSSGVYGWFREVYIAWVWPRGVCGKKMKREWPSLTK